MGGGPEGLQNQRFEKRAMVAASAEDPVAVGMVLDAEGA